jgi:gp16 family phage-associated protein
MARTLEEVRAEFAHKGISFAEWARANNVPERCVQGLLSGRTKGVRGDGRRAALKLGLVDPDNGESVVKAGSIELLLPESEEAEATSLRTTEAIKEALLKALKASKLSREKVAKELSRLTGHDISIHQLNNWAAPSKEDRPTPLHFLAAITEVTGSPALAEAALDGTGYRLLGPEDAVFYEIGRAEVAKKKEAKRRKELWEKIGK